MLVTRRPFKVLSTDLSEKTHGISLGVEVEENSKDFHVRSEREEELTLRRFCRPWLFRKHPLGRLGLSFDVISLHIRQALVYSSLLLVKIQQFLQNFFN